MTCASDLGLTVGSKIKVIALGNNHACFCEGDIIEFVRDDGTLSPWFKKVGDILDHSPFSLRTHTWEHYKEDEKDIAKLKFPCCVATSEIKDEATFKKILDLFVANGAEVDDKFFHSKENWNWFGVDVNAMSTQYYDHLDSYEERASSKVTIYTVEELLAMLPEEDSPVASQEAITDVLESKPSVGIDSSDSGYKEPTESLVSITKEVKYTVTIKGVDFTFTQDEVNELFDEIVGFVEYE